jgi:hypothetical protein
MFISGPVFAGARCWGQVILGKTSHVQLLRDLGQLFMWGQPKPVQSAESPSERLVKLTKRSSTGKISCLLPSNVL